VIFGEIGNEQVAALKDLNKREFVIMFTLAVMVIGLGLWPQPLTDVMSVTLQHLIEQASHSKL
jgi:NADH-quinone oxidoreductase subunit M